MSSGEIQACSSSGAGAERLQDMVRDEAVTHKEIESVKGGREKEKNTHTYITPVGNRSKKVGGDKSWGCCF